MTRTQLISSFVLIANVALCAYYYLQLPDSVSVPTHFNYLGEADSFGGKSFIFMSAGIGAVLFLFLHFILKYTSKKEGVNPKEIEFMNWLSFVLQALFLYISISILAVVVYENPFFAKGMLPIICILVTVILVQSFRIKIAEGKS